MRAIRDSRPKRAALHLRVCALLAASTRGAGPSRTGVLKPHALCGSTDPMPASAKLEGCPRSGPKRPRHRGTRASASILRTGFTSRPCPIWSTPAAKRGTWPMRLLPPALRWGARGANGAEVVARDDLYTELLAARLRGSRGDRNEVFDDVSARARQSTGESKRPSAGCRLPGRASCFGTTAPGRLGPTRDHPSHKQGAPRMHRPPLRRSRSPKRDAPSPTPSPTTCGVALSWTSSHQHGPRGDRQRGCLTKTAPAVPRLSRRVRSPSSGPAPRS
jgi:hypothetical protein